MTKEVELVYIADANWYKAMEELPPDTTRDLSEDVLRRVGEGFMAEWREREALEERRRHGATGAAILHGSRLSEQEVARLCCAIEDELNTGRSKPMSGRQAGKRIAALLLERHDHKIAPETVRKRLRLRSQI